VGEPTASLGHHGISRKTVLCNAVSLASLNAQEHIGTWPWPCAMDWTPALAPVQAAQATDSWRVLPLTRTWHSLAHGRRAAHMRQDRL